MWKTKRQKENTPKISSLQNCVVFDAVIIAVNLQIFKRKSFKIN